MTLRVSDIMQAELDGFAHHNVLSYFMVESLGEHKYLLAGSGFLAYLACLFMVITFLFILSIPFIKNGPVAKVERFLIGCIAIGVTIWISAPLLTASFITFSNPVALSHMIAGSEVSTAVVHRLHPYLNEGGGKKRTVEGPLMVKETQKHKGRFGTYLSTTLSDKQGHQWVVSTSKLYRAEVSAQ